MATEVGSSSSPSVIARERSISDAGAVHNLVQDPRTPEAVHLPRSASYTYFPPVKDLDYEEQSVVELKGKISEAELRSSRDEDSPYSSSGGSTPENEPNNLSQTPTSKPEPAAQQPSRIRLSRLLSTASREPRSAPVSQGERKEDKQKESERGRDLETEKVPQPPKTEQREHLKSKRSSAHAKRKSWVPSRSNEPSPNKNKVEETDGSPRPAPERRRSIITGGRRKSILRKDSDVPTTDERSPPKPARRKSAVGKEAELPITEEDRPSNRTSRRLSILRKTSDQPNSEEERLKTAKKETPLPPLQTVKDEGIPPVPQVPDAKTTTSRPNPTSPSKSSFSTDRLPSLLRSPPSSESIPPLKTFSLDTPKKKDELWGQFRSLDGDFQKFSSKSIALKANVVRQCLFPFLRTYANHPSNQRLRPEDLDRRTNILNKWWTGLLEMINGKNNQSISGSDRPHILEAIIGIMERPEWRSHPSPFCRLADKQAGLDPARSQSSSSVASSGDSDFLMESVHHNVRNTFIQNLTAQMAFAVDKMSFRNAPATLVTFSGKTCAYAFFFVPGMADILVRLWSPSLDAMRRVMFECKVSDRSKLDQVSSRILPPFPPNLHALGFTNLHKTFRGLRKPAPFPLGTSSLPWYGSWVKRWSGTESDLFYVFSKYFHILVTDFLPPDTTAAERLCAPGLIMVHAQILTNLDETLHRHAAMSGQKDEEMHVASSITFDDVLADGPDAAASALPIPPANAVRLMAENRLIMLLRDFLSVGSSHLATAPHVFAEAFSSLLQASARRVSMFDHNASYTLCDFLEEALNILLRYERTRHEDKTVLDWSFWISVYKRMTQSHNTTTEIRLLSFLYSLWATIIDDQDRKLQLCQDFLLEPEFFESRFNHWCPMLRAYYMRLVCWRIARFDGGDPTENEVKIFTMLEERLQSVWSHYLYLQEDAQSKCDTLPSTTPCNPAPGRRLLIIRHDAPLSPGNGPFLSFDGIVSNMPRNQASNALEAQINETTLRPSSSLSAASDSSDVEAEEPGKKQRWGLLRSLLRVPGQGRSKSRSPDPSSRKKEESKSDSAPNSPPSGKKNTPNVPPHRSYCFRFSLEWVNDKRFASPGPMRLFPPRLPPAAHNLLVSQRTDEEALTQKAAVKSKPEGEAATSSKYAGRALGEWAIVVGECQSFFQRRKDEGVPGNKLVETPTLGVEVFRRPG
ncbi:hypothetical protein HDK90DRAFT_502766 [Phyllosticta capitalensis]|uniref:DUF1765-domain-containing protein n=1 Tax=Phyllosticta capitalensis TaxID=121624 RepID=A0ABR1YTP0_9PEZI